MYFKAAVLVKKNIIKILNLKRPKLKKFQVFNDDTNIIVR